MVPARTLMMQMGAVRKLTRMALLVPTMCVALAACGDDAAEAEKARQAAATAAAAFTAEQQAWREERRSGLLKPDGWSSLIGLHWIEPGSHYIGSDADNGIRIEIGPSISACSTARATSCASCPNPASR
jgi:uncharacterized protein (DUF1684 family)